MKRLRRIGALLGAIVLVLAAVPFFITLDDYIPQIEREASARLGETVRIRSLRAAALPLPHLTVRGITVGASEEIKVGKVTVTPDLWTLFDSTWVIKSIEIDGLMLTRAALRKIPTWVPVGSKGEKRTQPSSIWLESIVLDDAVIELEDAAFGPFDARLSFSWVGSLESVSLATRDGAFTAVVRPQQSSYLIEASANRWILPVGPPIHFDELTVKGIATAKGASFSDMSARLYGGIVNGRVVLGWQKGVQLKGSAVVTQVEIASLLKALGRPQILSGRLNARPVFSGSAADSGKLLETVRMDAPIDVQNGVLRGVDLGKAASSLLDRDAGKGGETRFDHLSGHLSLRDGTRRLTQLSVASGSLEADGYVTISPGDELSGRIKTSVKAGSIAAVAVPLNVSGTLDSPLLYPTGGTVAGAAAGTAVLGPVFGTAIGAKVGQWFESLFGNKDDAK